MTISDRSPGASLEVLLRPLLVLRDTLGGWEPQLVRGVLDPGQNDYCSYMYKTWWQENNLPNNELLTTANYSLEKPLKYI